MEKRFSTPVRRSASCRSCRRYQQPTIASKSRSPSPYTNRRMCELSEDSRQRLAHFNLGPYAFKKELEDKPHFLVRHTPLDGSLSPSSSQLSTSPGGNLSSQESSGAESRGKSKMFFPELSAVESQRPSRSRDSRRMRIDELEMALGALNDPMPRETKRDAVSPKRTHLSRSAPSSIRRHSPSPVLNRSSLQERFQTARRKAAKWEDLHNRIKDILKTHRAPRLDLDNPGTWKTVYSSRSGNKAATRTKEKRSSPLRIPDTSVHLDKGEFWSNKASAYKGKSHRLIFEESMDKIYKNTYKKASSPRSHRQSPSS